VPGQNQPAANAVLGVQFQYIKDLSFESPNAPQIFATASGAPPAIEMGVNIATKRMEGGATHEVVLMLKLDAKIAGKTALIAELAYAGLFALPPGLPEESQKRLLLIECPFLLFPFARAILANAVREGGFPQILIHPIDFAALYDANKDNISPIAAPAGHA